MYHDVQRTHWWLSMMKDVINFVQKCLSCREIKVEYMRLGGTLQPLAIL